MAVRRKILIPAALGAACLSLSFLAPAAAETPSAVIEAVADDGVYVGPTFDLNEDALAAEVAAARLNGLNLFVIAPTDPLPDAESFGLRVLQASGTSGIDAVIVFTEDGDNQVALADEHSDRAVKSLEAAQGGATPEASVEAVAQAITAEPKPSVPAAIDVVQNWVFLLLVVFVGAVVVDVLWRQRMRRELDEQRAAQAKASERVQSNA